MEKPANKFIDVPVEQRAVLMEEAAIGSNIQKVRRDFTPQEKAEIKDRVVEQAQSIKETKAEMKDIVKQFNDALKGFNESMNGALEMHKKGFAENEEKVYVFESEIPNMVDVFDANGEYIETRSMRPEERQTRIVEMPKTGTHG